MAGRSKNRKMILQLDRDDGFSKGSFNNLQSLLGHYNSEDEDENSSKAADEKPKENEEPKTNMDGQFQDFMNEINMMETTDEPNPSENETSEWQELWDPQSGYPYYWNTKTNELTWDRPANLTSTKTKKPEAPKPHSSSEKPLGITSQPPGPAKNEILMGPEKPPVTKETIEVAAPQPVIADVGPKLPKETAVLPFQIKEKTETSKADQKESREVSVAPELPKQQVYDVDAIIAEIEREIPPDSVANGKDKFVPLFKRRKFTDKPEVGPKLSFKTYFSMTSLPLFSGDDEREAFAFEQPTESTNTKKVSHFGIGYNNETEENSKANSEINFIKGDTLQPMVAEIVDEPKTRSFDKKLDDFKKLLADKTVSTDLSEPTRLSIQLEVLLQARDDGALPECYIEKWLEQNESKLQEVDTAREDETSEKPEDRMGDNLQVENMDLAESDAEPEEKSTEPIDKTNPDIDSALSSFYSDLATLET